MTADQAQTELDKAAIKNNLDLPKEGEINKKAMKDFATYAKDLKDQGKLDPNRSRLSSKLNWTRTAN